MPGALQPLSKEFQIVDERGQPTDYFIRWAQERQIDISEGISAEQAQQLIDDWAAARDIIAGTGLGGGGNLSADVTIDLDADLDDLNDVDTTTTPPTDGQALVWNDGDAKWEPGDVASSGGGGTPWTLIDQQTISSPVANIDFLNLGAYDELLLVIDNVTLSAVATRTALVSVDNGLTWFNTSGNYREYPTSGSVTNVSNLTFHGTAASGARSAAVHLLNNISGSPKPFHRVNVDGSSPLVLFSASLASINAVRFNATSGNLTGGDIYVYGRGPAPRTWPGNVIQEYVCAGGETEVVFSDIPQTFRDLRVNLNGRGTNASTSVDIALRFNGDTGANYDYQRWNRFGTTAAVAQTSGQIGSIAAASAPASRPGSLAIELLNYTSTSFYRTAVSGSNGVSVGTAANDQVSTSGLVTWRNTAAITSITVLPSAGAFVAGTVVTLYGLGGPGSSSAGNGFTAYVDFTPGSPPVINKSSGISGVTRTAAGRYNIQFSLPFSNTYYAMSGHGSYNDSVSNSDVPVIGVDRRTGLGKFTTNIDVVIRAVSGVDSDNMDFVHITFTNLP